MLAIPSQNVIELEAQYIAPTYRRPPIVFERGEGVWLYDTEGNTYLDFVAGIAVNALGYGHPEMLTTLEAQARQLIHVSNLYHTAPHVLLARDLCESSFADRVFFCNSGTEANEGALKFARKWARLVSGNDDKYEIVAFSRAFHGRSMGALAVTANEAYRKSFEPLVPGVRWATFNDLESARQVIGPRTAAVIVEPIQGEGGIFPATHEFLTGLRALCDQHGAALIFDEVQCGLGRTGTLWAYEQYGVAPDIMALAKPLGGGLPIGAVLMTEAIASVLAPGDHGSTFAASPLVTAVAHTVFRTIRQPEFLDHVRRVGTYLGERLHGLSRRFPDLVREVRGRGLMWGLELTEGHQPADVVQAGYAHGLIVAPTGHNTVRLIPPLIVQEEHVDMAVSTLEAIFDHLGRTSG
ncbi:MAG: aspartate aminotransferase family protein [Ardenticatenia bacterium]|nr:aspartate aminotransferase family protein [Ardenticatenia bacterium]